MTKENIKIILMIAYIKKVEIVFKTEMIHSEEKGCFSHTALKEWKLFQSLDYSHSASTNFLWLL